MTGLIRNIFRQRNLIVFFIIAIIILGIRSYSRLPIDAFPDVTNIQVMILTEVPGFTPVDVEQQITFPIEVEMSGLPGVVQVRSLSKTGLSQVVVIFGDNYDTYFTRQLVFERLQLAKENLPEGVEPKLGPISTGLGEIYQYTLSSDRHSPTELRTIQDWVIAPQLRAIPGVNEVNSFGGMVKQFNVLAKPEMLIKYRITLKEIFEAIRANNANAGGRFIVQGWEQFNIRSVGLIGSIEDIEKIVLKAEDGTPVFLSDVADVQIGHVTRWGTVTRDGMGETVAGMVIMLKGENSKSVVNRVKEKITQIEKSLPEGVKINTFYDRTLLIQGCVNTITNALMQGGLLVIIILFLFLWNLRAALIVSISLPISALIAFIFMDYSEVTANLMSLGGIAIAIGIIVDGSIVVIENMVRHLSENDPTESDKLIILTEAVAQVARPVIFSILIIIIVFLPLFSLEQMEGKMFKPLALTLCFAMFGSLFVSLVAAPVIGWILLPFKRPRVANPIVRYLDLIYHPLLKLALRFRWLVIAATVVLLLSAVSMLPWLGMEFLPELDEGAIAINIVRFPTASLEGAKEVGTFIEKRLLKYEEIETIVTKTGRAEISEDPMGPEQNDMIIILKPYDKWKPGRKKADLIEDIREELSMIPGIRPSFSQPIALRVNELISGIKSDVAIKIFGDDLVKIKEIADEIASVLIETSGAVDVKVEQISGLEQIELIINRERIARHKINVEDINDIVEIAIGGKVATTVVEKERRFGIQLRYPEHARTDVQAIKGILVPSPMGYTVPLESLVEVAKVETAAQISRENNLRRVVVECNVVDRDIDSFISELKDKLAGVEKELPFNYFIDFGGQFENQKRAMRRLSIIVPLCIFLIFLMLYSGLGSLRSALLVLTNLPFALVGGIFAIMILKVNLSVSAVIGFIALLGMAVANGMVLITFIDQSKKQGATTSDAIITACRVRLRPLVMTTMTTLFGLMPMVYSNGIGAEIQRPLAIVVLGGLTSALMLTLFVLPVLYSLVYNENDNRV